PPGTYTYNITIDGEPRGELAFCALEIPDQNPNTDPRELNCPNKFNSVERAHPRGTWPPGILPAGNRKAS
ncbi:MAG: hypothetical protein JOY81_14665, partial [Alphaproteobacteria bacterium]|nr:hypothetical protein [Alphaproteobacteria bacterium]